MNKLFLDIETLPACKSQHETLKVLFEKKKKEEDTFEDFIAKTSFDGAYGRILCIGYAFDDSPAQTIHSENEAEILESFWQIAQKARLFVGHNILDFDLRFIYQRSIILGVRPSVELNFARYRSFPIYDTMKEWVKWSNVSTGLEHLALALGIPTPKDGIDGSQVAKFYEDGKVDEILEYCKRDVETTRDVYRKMIFETTPQTLFD